MANAMMAAALAACLAILITSGALYAADGGASPATSPPAAGAPAGPPLIETFADYPVEQVFDVTNGTIEKAKDGNDTILRWRGNVGQTSVLALKRTSPIFARLRMLDRLTFEFRIAGGEISTIGLTAQGQVSGYRQSHAHQWGLAIATTPRGVWHWRSLDLARPNWFPWETADGEGIDGYFNFDMLAIAPDTMVEIRGMKLTRNLVILKPDYEMPITWPVKTDNADGSITYTSTYQVLNASGRPAQMTAKVLTSNKRFAVTFEEPQKEAKPGTAVAFTLKATMSKADIDATPPLFAEPLRLAFATADCPQNACVWVGELARPLPKDVRRQVVMSADDLKAAREKIKAQDAAFTKAIGYAATINKANEFLTKELLHIPAGHSHPGTGGTGAWKVGNAMPEVVEANGAREFGTGLAGTVWKYYLESSGGAGGACDMLGTAYLLTGDEKYAKKAIELFRLYGRQYTENSWSVPNEIGWLAGTTILGSSRLAANSTYGSNWVFKGHCRLLSMVSESPSWTPADRQAVYLGLALPYVTELLKFPGGVSNMTDITNHNVLLMGLVFDDAHMVRRAVLSDPGVISRLADIDSDGFSAEGRPMNYHMAGMTEYLPSVVYLANSGLKVDFPKEQLLAAVRMPFQRATLWGQIPTTGDNGRGARVAAFSQAEPLLSLFPKETWLLDICGTSRLHTQLLRQRTGKKGDPNDWRKMLESSPRLFAAAGLAILRTGATPQDQVMVTLDYGRNIFHAALDRMQITLAAHGKMFTVGPGSLYNVGSGGMTRTNDRHLESFCGHGSLGQNVIMVDMQDQLPAIGRLLAWNATGDIQAAVARIEGVQPGVSHTRGVVLAKGVVIVLDRVESAQEHTYDFVYHNLGSLKLGQGWSAAPTGKPIGQTANYGNIVDPKRLSGNGNLLLTWDLADQFTKEDKADSNDLKLHMWQLPVAGGEIYVGDTGMNNPNTAIVPDAAPSLFHRVVGRNASFVTVLDPASGAPAVTGVAAADGGVTVTFADGKTVTVSLDGLIKQYGVKTPPQK